MWENKTNTCRLSQKLWKNQEKASGIEKVGVSRETSAVEEPYPAAALLESYRCNAGNLVVRSLYRG